MRTPDENVRHFFTRIGESDECDCSDCKLEWQIYAWEGLPWTAEFEEAVNAGLVDVS